MVIGMPGDWRAGVDERHDFLADVFVEHALAPAAVEGMRAAVQERVLVVRADAEHLEAAGVDEVADGVDQPVALQLPLVAVAGREGQQRRSPVSEDRDAHVPAEAR